MPEFSLTELTDRLQGPDGAQVKEQLMQQLESLHHKVEMSLKGGTKPAEFDEYEKIKSAVSTATNILNSYTK